MKILKLSYQKDISRLIHKYGTVQFDDIFQNKYKQKILDADFVYIIIDKGIARVIKDRESGEQYNVTKEERPELFL